MPDYASMLTVDSLNTHVVAQVAETDLNSVHVGQEAHVSLPAYPGSDYTALVQSIDPTAVDQDGHASYLVYLDSSPGPVTAAPIRRPTWTGPAHRRRLVLTPTVRPPWRGRRSLDTAVAPGGG